MNRDQLKEAILNPLAVSGGTITPQTLNRLLNDVGDNPDQLPILQHVLMRTWQSWRASGRHAVDLEHYEAIGTMSESLSRHVDEAYEELSHEGRLLAGRLFKALTELGPDNREITRPTTVGGLCAIADASPNEVAKVIETFRRSDRSFLMPPPGVPLEAETLIDVSHESLIRNWRRLKAWVADEANSARMYKRVAEQASYYRIGQAGLWRGSDLELALKWRDHIKPNEAWARRYHPEFATAMIFLEDSVNARTAEILETERRQQRAIRRSHWTTLLIALLSALTIVGFFLAYIRR
jgi:hypothetical protein